MNILRKIALNLGWRAFLVLGPRTYLRYLFTFICYFRFILRTRNLSPLDQAMSSTPIKIRMKDGEFVLDCPFTDRHINDGTFTFGVVREMYIRNCYLRYGVSQASGNARTILDLGANRGAFSIMMARHAGLVIAVEANPLFKDVIAHNMAINGFTNYEIETVFVGRGGMCDSREACRMTIVDLLKKYNLQDVDLVKMDIEGSEFDLFKSSEWLKCISALCMEVHPEYGDPQEIVTALERHGFTFVVADREFHHVDILKNTEFIYAWK